MCNVLFLKSSLTEISLFLFICSAMITCGSLLIISWANALVLTQIWDILARSWFSAFCPDMNSLCRELGLILTWGYDVWHAGVALVPDRVAGVAEQAAVVLRGPGEVGDGLAAPPSAPPLPWHRAPVSRTSNRKLNEFLERRKVKRISVSFDAAESSICKQRVFCKLWRSN